MKPFQFSILLLLLFSTAAGPAAEPAYYLWQRSWTPAVRQAAGQCGRPLLIFAAELSGSRTERSDAPAGIWKKEEVTAVFRLRAGALNPAGFQRLAAEITRNGCAKVQLDIDVPERRLEEYAKLLETLKRALPPEVNELSLTALPCHLGRKEFAAVAQFADYYVLQLHGLDVPAHIDDRYSLLDGEAARTAIRRARQLGRPFRIALPAYAYRLSFGQDGSFAAISAEGAAPPGNRYRSRLAAPELKLLAGLIRENSDLRMIWFRLPVEGDRLCYDRTTLEALEQGKSPSPRLDIELRRVAKNALELWITPQSQLRLEPVELTLKWPSGTGEFEPAPGTERRPREAPFGILPDRLSVAFPGCGTPVRAATFLVDETNHPVVKEIQP